MLSADGQLTLHRALNNSTASIVWTTSSLFVSVNPVFILASEPAITFITFEAVGAQLLPTKKCQ